MENKERSDKGLKRGKYKLSLHPKYRNHIAKANSFGIYSELTEEQFLMLYNSPCHYCGGSSKMGITRIDMHDGFYIDNVRPCCYDCNMMKNKSDEYEFIRRIQKLCRYNNAI